MEICGLKHPVSLYEIFPLPLLMLDDFAKPVCFRINPVPVPVALRHACAGMTDNLCNHVFGAFYITKPVNNGVPETMRCLSVRQWLQPFIHGVLRMGTLAVKCRRIAWK